MPGLATPSKLARAHDPANAQSATTNTQRKMAPLDPVRACARAHNHIETVRKGQERDRGASAANKGDGGRICGRQTCSSAWLRARANPAGTSWRLNTRRRGHTVADGNACRNALSVSRAPAASNNKSTCRWTRGRGWPNKNAQGGKHVFHARGAHTRPGFGTRADKQVLAAHAPRSGTRGPAASRSSATHGDNACKRPAAPDRGGSRADPAVILLGACFLGMLLGQSQRPRST